MLAIIGDQFAECEVGVVGEGGVEVGGEDGAERERGEYPEICGGTISVRQNEDIMTVWNRTEADPRVKDKIQCVLWHFYHALSCSSLWNAPLTFLRPQSNNPQSPEPPRDDAYGVQVEQRSALHSRPMLLPLVLSTYTDALCTDSMQDKSSFRVPAGDRTPLS